MDVEREKRGELKAPGAAAISRAARMSNSQEGRSRQTHPGGLGDENKLASEHWWPFRSLLGGLSESRREVARLWLRLLRQKRRLTSLISDENENEFDPFFSLSLSPSSGLASSFSLKLARSLTRSLSLSPYLNPSCLSFSLCPLFAPFPSSFTGSPLILLLHPFLTLPSFLSSTFHSFCIRLSPFLSFSFLPREPCGGAAPGSVGFLFSSRKRNQVSGTREGRSRLTGETLICVLALITLRPAPAVS